MSTNEEIINELLTEFKGHRAAIMEMIVDIEKLKDKIDTLLPDRLDARYVRFFEEKVKTATEFFKTLLEMRKEIQKSLKDEIDLRRKINVHESSLEIEDIINIRSLASKVEEFKRKKDELTAKSVEEAQEATDEIAEHVKKVNLL
jgi:cellulose biosynthesis protein BcsQ